MTFKFTVTCKSCGCRAELTAGAWEQSGLYKCPNCNTRMEDATFQTLRQAASTLDLICGETESFSISLGERFLNPSER